MQRTALILVVLALLVAPAVAAPPARPNVVILLADDQGWGDLSVSGNPNLATPNIDSLARGGVTLNRFFVCPVCAPTRAEFLTGRYHPRSGVRGVSTGQERMNTEAKTLADHLKAAGYATGAFGKWHNGSQWPYHPNARGFDEYYGFTSGHWGEYFDPPLEHNGKAVRGKGFIADDLTDHALAFIERNAARPFLCYLPFNTPHSPFCVPDAYWERFKDKPITLRGRDGEKEDIEVTRCALAMCENIDWNVGRVLRKLDELKLAEKTVVIYFSDNGPNSSRWNGDMKGRKGSTDEGGVRVPFFIRWPGHLPAGRKVDDIAGAIDVLPTLANMAGIAFPAEPVLDGRDLTPLLMGQTEHGPDRMLFTHQNGRVSVRTQRYRLDERGALFDLQSDPGQKTNISAREPETTERLRQAVADWRTEVLNASGADDRPFPVGHPEFPFTPLPARDGVSHGTILRSAHAPNCSYFVNWTNRGDTMTWDIEVATAGSYAVEVLYACPDREEGSMIEVSFQGEKRTGRIPTGWDGPLLDRQDRVPRKGESYMKEFRPLDLGTMHLRKGRGALTLGAVEIAKRTIGEIRQINLTLVHPDQPVSAQRD